MKKGWEVKKLGDLCTIQLGKTPHRKTERYWDKDKNTSNCWLSIADMVHGKELFDSKEYVSNLGAENINITPKGTLILSFKLTIGRVSFAGKDLFTNEAIASLINLSGDINKEYLFYYFTFFDWDKATDGDIKVKGKTLNKAKLKALSIIAPPLPEQQRIVKILDKAFVAIDKAKQNAEQNLRNAKEVFENYLQGVFDNGKLKVENGEWEEKKLGEICTITGGGTPSKKKDEFYAGDILWATVRDMKVDIIEKTEHKITPEAVSSSSTKIIPKGNVIIATRVGLGKVCLLKKDTAINQDLKGIVPKKSKSISTDFLYRWFTSISNKIIAEGTGATVQGVKLTFINSLQICLPPIKKQKQIVQELDALQAETKKLELIYQQKISDLEELKKSILQKAFRGEL